MRCQRCQPHRFALERLLGLDHRVGGDRLVASRQFDHFQHGAHVQAVRRLGLREQAPLDTAGRAATGHLRKTAIECGVAPVDVGLERIDPCF